MQNTTGDQREFVCSGLFSIPKLLIIEWNHRTEPVDKMELFKKMKSFLFLLVVFLLEEQIKCDVCWSNKWHFRHCSYFQVVVVFVFSCTAFFLIVGSGRLEHQSHRMKITTLFFIVLALPDSIVKDWWIYHLWSLRRIHRCPLHPCCPQTKPWMPRVRCFSPRHERVYEQSTYLRRFSWPCYSMLFDHSSIPEKTLD